MTNKHADLSINLSIICLLAVASSLTGYQLWHRGAHGSEYLQNPTFWASAELPRIPAFHYGDGPFGTYVLVLGGACPSCTEEVDFCRRAAVAAKRTTKGTKLVVVYARGDRRIQGDAQAKRAGRAGYGRLRSRRPDAGYVLRRRTWLGTWGMARSALDHRPGAHPTGVLRSGHGAQAARFARTVFVFQFQRLRDPGVASCCNMETQACVGNG
jgi:hypothetical protein